MVFVFAAPGAPRAHYPHRIPVRFWHMWTAEWKTVVDRIVTRFNESQDKYEVIALSVPSTSADAKFLLAVVGGDPPDLMAQWNPIIPTWAQSGMLRPLDDLMTSSERERFFREAYPIAKKIGVYQDRLYGMAIGVNIWALYYRPDQLREAGLDPSPFSGVARDAGRLGREARSVRFAGQPGAARLFAQLVQDVCAGFRRRLLRLAKAAAHAGNAREPAMLELPHGRSPEARGRSGHALRLRAK